MIDVIAASAAWLGASLIVLADGRRGLALGAAIAAAGIGLAAYPGAGLASAVLIGAGGLVAAVWRLSTGPPGWKVMPAGSTPRLVLCVAAGLLTLWIAVSVTSGPDPGLRFAVIVGAGLAAARILGADEPAVLLTAAVLLALAVGAGAGVAGARPGIWPYAAAAAIAAGAGFLPVSVRRAG